MLVRLLEMSRNYTEVLILDKSSNLGVAFCICKISKIIVKQPFKFSYRYSNISEESKY